MLEGKVNRCEGYGAVRSGINFSLGGGNFNNWSEDDLWVKNTEWERIRGNGQF